MRQPNPVKLEIYQSDEDPVQEYGSGYSSINPEAGGFSAGAEVHLPGVVKIFVQDTWRVEDSTLHVSRTINVEGNAPGGFVSAIMLDSDEGISLSSLKVFVPGIIYGTSEYITPTAIGGKAHYEAGVRQVRIREDRLPIPMVGLYYSDGNSVTVFNPRPDARSTVRDAEEKIAGIQINKCCRVSALGYCEAENRVSLGLWFPGTEGEVTYQWALAPENQVRKWRGRYYPFKAGFTQCYEAEFRFAHGESFTHFYTTAWRSTWEKLAPQVTPQNIELVCLASIAMVADRVVSAQGMSGIPTIWDSTTGKEISTEDSILSAKKREAVMGFLGRNTDVGLLPSLRSGTRGNRTSHSIPRFGHFDPRFVHHYPHVAAGSRRIQPPGWQSRFTYV